MSAQIVPQYQVVSWNIGRDTDYLGLNIRNKHVKWSHLNELKQLRNQLFVKAFSHITETLNPDFFCLQEVTRSADVRQLLGGNYELHAASRDCVIAWNQEKYELIEASPVIEKGEGRYLVLDLLEKSTQKTIRIASAHLWGFNLTTPDENERGAEEPVTRKGDIQLMELAEQMDRPASLSIIGMDANTTPDIHQERLSILESKGFLRDKSQDALPTAFNSSLESQSAHLDYLFAKGSKEIVLEGAFFESFPIESPSVNPSDHSPISLKVTVVDEKKSCGLLKKIVSLFKTS